MTTHSIAVASPVRKQFQFAIDRGGTFTDVYARCPNGKTRILKLLSEDGTDYSDAPREAIRRIIEQETGKPLSQDTPINTSNIDWIRMGTTVATNALLERKGERMVLVITKGFRDLLYIGNQSRPKIFDLKIETPDVLYEDVIEVDERIVVQQAKNQRNELETNYPVVTGITGENVKVWKSVDAQQVRIALLKCYSQGIRSAAVVLMHSYTYPEHEIAIGEIAKEIGYTQVSLSAQVMPMVRIVPRGFTCCADAYLTPSIRRYVNSFAQGFKGGVEKLNVLFMQSDGGLTPVDRFTGSRAILSGPAGGVVGYALTTYNKETNLPVIGFDMGGTSTDVSRFAGQYEHVFETTTAGITIQAPQLDINTVAAGGGSMLIFRSGLFIVGPESAGAHPGPACYRNGGPLCVTDANLVLGRLLIDHFPKIFGPDKNESLDLDASRKALEKLTTEVNEFLRTNSLPPMTVHEVAMGYIRVANESMCRPIRVLTEARGYDASKHVLACFGGAGGQHACAIAKSLGMKTIFIHRYAGILSAYGMALADVVQEVQEPCAKVYEKGNFAAIDDRIHVLAQRCVDKLMDFGFQRDMIELEPFLHLRFEGTDCALMCGNSDVPANEDSSKYGDFRAAFMGRYQREFGFTLQNRNILVDDIRVRGMAKTGLQNQVVIPKATGPPETIKVVECYFDSRFMPTKLFLLETLQCGHQVEGPAILIDPNFTVLVEPGCVATITEAGDVRIDVLTTSAQRLSTRLDAIQLSIFSHRFMCIAEQMGRVLQRTSISTNIKERLDFSCALFGPDGGLVANAPHIPVHIGAMQETIQFQIKAFAGHMKDGDVFLSNHPQAGGSHLPDLTVVTPVFLPTGTKPIFFVASRGHHADIGGITPGSMPAHSNSLLQEGARFKAFRLVENGVFQEEALIAALMEPANHPGSSAARNIRDNVSDLQAQVAANHKGIQLMLELCESYGLEIVQTYMKYIQDNAEVVVRDLCRTVGQTMKEKTGSSRLFAEDHMDDGTLIVLQVDIDVNEGSVVFDFNGTGIEVFGNCNAPRAVTYAAILYCLRCMIGHDIPLNQGCLNAVTVIIPKGTILNPSENAAVVGGNVLTSQRIVDVIFKAFEACAASQGCMNNITFGDETCGYYETVAGGAGAGPSWDGRSGIHTHMTNTRITDPEILEKRYPVILRQFSLRPKSGGKGAFNGGDGIIRELMFRKNLTLSILTERRVFRPYGLQGGEPGLPGRNVIQFKDGRAVSLGSKSSIEVEAGDCLILETPGGGGWGDRRSRDPSKQKSGNRTFYEKGSLYDYRSAQEGAPL